MEWMQAQWKRHLNLKIDLQPVEQGVYLRQLRDKTPALFRKGVGPDRATCSAALEIFSPQDPENFIAYENKKFLTTLNSLKLLALDVRSSKSKSAIRSRGLCSEGIHHLLQDFAIIPMGRIHFTVLAQPEWRGWTLNPLNQLDLGRLTWTSPRKPPRPESKSATPRVGNP
jgi:oligopeptide transport system substrate-binding protein